MPVHIESVAAKITVFDGEIPLSDKQLRQITDHVLRALASRERTTGLHRAATEIRTSSQPHHIVAKDGS